MPYVSGHCDHGLSSWFPRREETSNLARNYTIALRSHIRDTTTSSNAYMSYATRPAARTSRRAEIKKRFERYADDWKFQTAHESVMSRRVFHPSYLRIIGLGQEALPLILHRLSSQPDHWFWALQSISGEDPVRPEDAGRFDAMRDAWIAWGRNRGLVR